MSKNKNTSLTPSVVIPKITTPHQGEVKNGQVPKMENPPPPPTKKIK